MLKQQLTQEEVVTLSVVYMLKQQFNKVVTLTTTAAP
jgi:hypothetical protein